MVLADVVSLLASTKRMTVAAYASDGSATRGAQNRRAAGMRIQTTMAAMPERNEATCQEVSAQALIPAPPTEKSRAAARTCKRAWVRKFTGPTGISGSGAHSQDRREGLTGRGRVDTVIE